MASKSRKAAGRRLANMSKCAWKKARASGKYRYVKRKGSKKRTKVPLEKHYKACGAKKK
jgi:hypothetical protein